MEPSGAPPSRTLAAILGPTLVSLAASEALNLHIWRTPHPQVVYLNGVLLLVTGLAVIRLHNLWRWRWPVLITLVGWATALAGVYRMFAPGAPQVHAGPAAWLLLAMLGIVGLVLSVFGWRR